MRNKLRAIINWFTPSPQTCRGAAWGIAIITAILWLITGYDILFRPRPHLGIWLVYLGITIAAPAAGLLIRLLLNLLRSRNARFDWTFAACFVMLMLVFIGANPGASVGFALAVILCASLVGGGIAARSGEQRGLAMFSLSLGALWLIIGSVWLLWDGKHRDAPPNAAANTPAPAQLTGVADPSLPGPYQVRTLTYGSGSDLHRTEYASGAAIKTKAVDGSAFIENWKDRAGWARTRFWGFDSKKLPIQGRVWYPAATAERPGPFPLVLIVHGNHTMEDFSDPGYGYLGELMASRGFIFASVDENFLNSSFSDLLGMPDIGLKEENDARGWMLLEHVRVWKEWNTTAGNPFAGKVDTEHIALIGHSRGGEAVAIAASFNRLPYYPDNARIKLGYNHAILAVAAIAPVDGQYKPAGIGTPIENVSYFVLHGSADGDVQSFHGSRQYHRVKFTGKDYHFKSTLYINDANHGQFNTSWGRFDNGQSIGSRLLNYAQIMPPDAQRRIAKVYLSAYLECTLHGNREYLPLFEDHRVAPGWLPAGIYLHQFEDSTFQTVSNYEEDLDVTTTTMPGGRESGERLCDWKERMVKLKWGDMDTRAVFLGWNTKESGGAGSYTITLPPTGLHVDAKSTLLFSLSDAKQDPSPWSTEKKEEKKKKEDDKKKDQPIELTVEISDGSETARIPVTVQRQIETHVLKADWLGSTARFETLFQSFDVPLAKFTAANPKLKAESVRLVRFIFDRSEKGVVVLDDIAFRGQRE